MSGGRFEYIQDRLEDVADRVEELIADNDAMHGFASGTITRFRDAALALRIAATMTRRIDWLVSGDDSEQSFHVRWIEDLIALTDYGPSGNPDD
jgi:hypothetical protein